jgi:prepilin-type N-terminal cleavage/methylation domain-containing protein
VNALRTERGGAGFTLIELMAVVLLTGIVLGAAADSYLDLSGASRVAVESSREAREAVGILDRMARDLEGAVLVVKPEGDDRLGHPWLFYAEADSEAEGARRVKFVTRSHRPRATDAPESDLAVVAFVAEAGDDGTLVLRRALSPGLGEELDRSFPRDERDGADELADGLARFGMRFLTEEGALEASFDSTGIVHADQLPVAAEIELAFAHVDEDGVFEAGPPFIRQVKLPLRPLDLEAELGVGDEEVAEDEEDEEDETADGMTVQECLAKNPAILAELDVPPEVLDSIREQPISSVGLSKGDCE